MTLQTTDTAHLAWEAAWQSEAGRADWLVPEPEVVQLGARLRQAGAARALDLGCGVGRHALALARLGFRVEALDASPSGLAELTGAAAREGLEIAAHRASMTGLPCSDARFDLLLSWNVIYHGDPTVVHGAIAEIARVLRPGGIFQGTMLSKRNRHFRQGHEIAPDTWVDEAGEGDKAHPHFFCDATELCALFTDFELLTLHQDDHGKAGHWHWHLTAERR
ncbi:class I SAM-dependent methyltransferase [Algihabitans albus]|uniref:class I SAM-dependent methyltransferase n=1 Tax=Algihabitans albus TaxID=2164067 RepID=UPI000E5C9DEC|nr:class I SAM-dependent methyltransferase [Algihabitans albus]